jgi:pyruvate formate lyase activating enzyme
MIIAGLQKTTLIDYPGKIAATVFLAGCNFRCPWCYSPELVLPEKINLQPKITEKEFFDFLKYKKGLLEGVAICGGEPCLNDDLPSFAQKIKKAGFLVKLDTNGSRPKMLGDLMSAKLIDYVAMDIKAPKKRYREMTSAVLDVEDIEKSISLLKKGSIDYEFRTTFVPVLLEKKDILEIAKWISGARAYYIQNFRPEKNIDSDFSRISPHSQEDLFEIQKSISPFFDICRIR